MFCVTQVASTSVLDEQIHVVTTIGATHLAQRHFVSKKVVGTNEREVATCLAAAPLSTEMLSTRRGCAQQSEGFRVLEELPLPLPISI